MRTKILLPVLILIMITASPARVSSGEVLDYGPIIKKIELQFDTFENKSELMETDNEMFTSNETDLNGIIVTFDNITGNATGFFLTNETVHEPDLTPQQYLQNYSKAIEGGFILDPSQNGTEKTVDYPFVGVHSYLQYGNINGTEDPSKAYLIIGNRSNQSISIDITIQYGKVLHVHNPLETSSDEVSSFTFFWILEFLLLIPVVAWSRRRT